MNRFLEWMDSSSGGQSLWRQEKYSTALLNYLASVYNHKNEDVRMIFDQLTDEDPDFKELDLLDQLIQRIDDWKSRKSLQKWEAGARIKRRLDDIQCILTVHEKFPPTIGPFTVFLHDVNYEIDPRSIHAYLDVGCGNGDITAAIGAYFHLMKIQIFGADVFDPNNPRINFILIDNKQNHIDIRQ